jgi:hypothetical protein
LILWWKTVGTDADFAELAPNRICKGYATDKNSGALDRRSDIY